MIRFEQVTRHYGDAEAPALREVSVEFNRGDFVFLIGASGSGKSTLLRMILREALPQRGRVTVAGQNLSLMLERRVPAYRRSVGMVFQDFRLLPDKTVYDNVAFAMRVIGAPRASIRKQVMKILSRVKLDHLAKRYPHEISGGEQQRAAIARAIVNSPAIVLADEPTGNLDPRASEEVMKILRWINTSGTTVIMATHDRAIVDRMNRRVVQLHNGQLVRDETPGRYDPEEGSQAWQILSAEAAATGLRAADPMPVRTEAAPVVPPADSPAPAAEDEPTAPQPAEDQPRPARMKVNHYRVTWPEDDEPAAETPEVGAAVDAANLPEFEEITDQQSAAEPEDGGPDPETDPVSAVEPASEPEPEPRLGGLGHDHDPAGEQPSQGPAPVEESSADEPAPSSAPRPLSSAAEASYADAKRTAEQIRSSKSGFLARFRRRS